MTAPPDRIWLQTSGDYEGASAAMDEVTWCDQPMEDGDHEYLLRDGPAMQAALAAAEARVWGWQPIATLTPKPGALYLLLDKVDQAWLGRWSKERGVWEQDDDVEDLMAITHWMLEVPETLTYINAAILALIPAPPAEPSPWQGIETAPQDGTPIQARIPGHGDDNIIAWFGGLLNSDGDDCGGWAMVEDQEPPDCWTDGVCWEVNADGNRSVQPTHWKPAPPADGGEG